MALLEAKDITKTFVMGPQELTVLHGITLSINKGEFLAITGKSGSGKSTLMNILGCLDVATTGTYHIDGEDVSTLSVDQLAHIRNQKVGFVFQHFHLLQDMSALENVELPQLYAGATRKKARERATAILELVDLTDRIKHSPQELSGGERQRVAIARALVNNPAIVLADEPTGNLDSVTGEKIVSLFKHLNQEQATTIVIITHDRGLAEETNRIIKLHDGKIV